MTAMYKTLEYPFTAAKVRELHVGQMVKVSGGIFTGRDKLHKFLFDGGRLPVELADGAIYHCGPVVVRENGVWVVRSAGPTTSMRADRYTARIMEHHHVRVMIGKGGMGDRTLHACARYGAVYLQAVGGAAVLASENIRQVKSVHFLKEFGSAEALWELEVQDFVAVVTMDSHGRSLHRKVKAASKRALARLIA